MYSDEVVCYAVLENFFALLEWLLTEIYIFWVRVNVSTASEVVSFLVSTSTCSEVCLNCLVTAVNATTMFKAIKTFLN